MYGITTETATQDHEFTDGDESQLIPPTDFNALWCNTIQRELLNILAGLGIAPDAANFAQIWDAMKMIGVRAIYSEGNVSTTEFDGSLVIFHDVSNFNIDTMKNQSVLIVVPLWSTSSASEITFHYGSQNHRIKKGFFYVGMVANGSIDGLSIVGVDLPRAFNGNEMIVGVLNADKVKSEKRYEKNLVQFENSNDIDSSGVEKWRSWQLMSNWEVGQVKRVHCVTSNDFQNVYVYFDDQSLARYVKFYKNGFLEFLCTGSRTVVVDGVSYSYATLLVNGGN